MLLLDYTEIKRPWAKNTKWIGTLTDGKTRGAAILTLSAPYIGEHIRDHALNKKERKKYSRIFVVFKQTYKYTASDLRSAINFSIRYLQAINSNKFYSNTIS